MNYWITSDTHLGHERVFEFEPFRKPFNSIIKDLNCVHPKDILIHLGDIGFKDCGEWLTKYRTACQGKIILCKGNHDSKSYTFFYRHGIDFVCEEFKLYIYGKPIIFSHSPVSITGNQINIHGHHHKKYGIDEVIKDYPFYNENHICFTTNNNCKPITLENILKERKLI